MPVLTIRGVPDEVHRALRLRAASNGHSMEAEVRDILKITLKQDVSVQMGEALASLGQRIGLTDDDFRAIEAVRENAPAEPVAFD